MELQYGSPFNLLDWSAENKHRLIPPVCNAAVFPDGNYIINMVGGPNYRTDYHINQTEEIFYQIKGKAYLNILDRGKYDFIPLSEGDIFLLPANLAHSPQRPDPNGLCFLVERPRPLDYIDKFLWYCASCGTEVYQIADHMDDLVANLPIAYKIFYDLSEEERRCQNCGQVHAGEDAHIWQQHYFDANPHIAKRLQKFLVDISST